MANKKKNNNESNLIFVIISIAIILCAYLMVSLIGLLAKPTETTLIKNGKIINSEDVIGYIIRNEEVLDNSGYGGVATVKAQDATRVAKNGTIMSYVSTSEKSLIDKIANIDREIQKVMEEEKIQPSSDTKTLETEIQSKLYMINSIKNNVYDVNEYMEDINQKIEKKAKIVGELSPTGSKIKKLITERNSYEKQINDAKQELKADTAGLVSYRIDNLESILTKKSIPSLTISQLERLKLSTGQVIPINVNNIKIIDNFECYIAVPMDSEESKVAQINDKVYLSFDGTDDSYVTSTIEYISDEENKRLIIFKITTNIEELVKYRKISLDVIWWRYTGLKIPNNAIKEKDILDEKGNVIAKMKYVTVQKSSYTQDIWIKVVRQTKNASIVSDYTDEELLELGIPDEEINKRVSIKMYDEILIN